MDEFLRHVIGLAWDRNDVIWEKSDTGESWPRLVQEDMFSKELKATLELVLEGINREIHRLQLVRSSVAGSL